MSTRYATNGNAKFLILASKVPSMLEAACAKAKELCSQKDLEQYPNLLNEALKTVLDMYGGFRLEADKEGNYTALTRWSERSNRGDTLFEFLEPFVEDGSYIEMESDGDGERLFRVVWKDGRYAFQYPIIVWE